MIKKLFLGVGLALGLGLLVFGRNLMSYVRTSANSVADSVRENVPVEFEIERARQLLKDIDPEVRKAMHVIAKEEVEVKQLEERIVQLEKRLAGEKEDVLRLKTDLEKGKGKKTFEYGGRKYSAEQVEADLAARFQRYKTGETTLTDWRKLLSARQKGVEAARAKLEGMLAARRQIEVDIENLEARRQMVAAAQTTAGYTVDDSQMGRIKELVSDLRTRLEVSEKLVAAEGTFHDEIPLREPSTDSVVDQVGKYFAPAPEAEQVAKGEK